MIRYRWLLLPLALIASACADSSRSTAPIAPQHDLDILVPTLPSPGSAPHAAWIRGGYTTADVPPEYQVQAGSSDAANFASFDQGAHARSNGHFTGTDISVQTHGYLYSFDGTNWTAIGSQSGQLASLSSLLPMFGQWLESSTTIPISSNCGLKIVTGGDFYAAVKYLGQVISGGSITVPEQNQETVRAKSRTAPQLFRLLRTQEAVGMASRETGMGTPGASSMSRTTSIPARSYP